MYDLQKEYGSLYNAIRNTKRLSVSFRDRQDYANHNSLYDGMAVGGGINGKLKKV